MGVSPDARATSSSVGEGRAKTEEAAANAAIVLKVFMILKIGGDGRTPKWLTKWLKGS